MNNQMVEEVLRDVRVDRRETVVQQVHVRIRVVRPRQRHPLLLASRQRQALFADLRLVAVRQRVHVGFESASSQRLGVARAV